MKMECIYFECLIRVEVSLIFYRYLGYNTVKARW